MDIKNPDKYKNKMLFKQVAIPSTINRLPVKALGEGNHIEADYVNYNGCYVEKLVLPDCIEFISPYAFWRSKAIKCITWPNSCQTIQRACFKESTISEVDIPEGVTVIEEYAFSGSSVIRVDIPNSCMSIGRYAFGDCRQLEQINLSNNINNIGNGAFCKTSIKSITWPEFCFVIPDVCFKACHSLENIYINGEISEIRKNAFLDTSVTSIDLTKNKYFCKLDKETVYDKLNIIKPFYAGIIY